MPDDDSVQALLAAIEVERARLRQILSGADAAAMAIRPARGGWSVVENLRHLLFAEQLHLGRFIAGGPAWSPLGFTPQTMRAARALPAVGDAPVPSIDAVFEAWDAVHAATTRALLADGTDAAPKALARNLKHLRAHTRLIERLTRDTAPAG